jgi:hypothetical protein
MPATPHPFGEGCRRRGKRQIKGERFRLIDLAADQHSFLPARRDRGAVGQIGPVIQPRSFAAVAGRQALPAVVSARSGRDVFKLVCDRLEAQPLGAGYGRHIATSMAFNQLPQPGIGSVDAIPDDPGARYAVRNGALQHHASELGFGREGDRLRHAGGGAPRWVAQRSGRSSARSIKVWPEPLA